MPFGFLLFLLIKPSPSTCIVMGDIRIWLRNKCRPSQFKDVASQLHQRNVQDPNLIVYFSLILVTLVWASIAFVRRARRKTASRPRSPDLEKPASQKPPERKPGGKGNIPNKLFPTFIAIDIQFARMDSTRLYPSTCISLSRLVRPHHQAPPLPPLPLWP